MSSRWSDRLRHALGFRLALWYSVLFLGSSIALIGMTYLLLASTLEQRDREIVRSTLTRYASVYQRGGLEALNRTIAADQAAGRWEPLLVRAIGRRQEALFLSMPADWWEQFDPAEIPVPPPGRPGWSLIRTGPGDVALEVATAALPDGTLFQVGRSTETRVELLSRFRRVLSIVLLSIVVIGLTGGAVLTWSTLQPIRNLIRAVQGILDTGRLHARVPVRQTGDALDELSRLFNRMLDRIEGLIAAMRGSLDNVAHDLRTPMTRLRGVAEAALQHPTPDHSTYRDALADCLEESERVVTMLDTLMDISEAETGTMKLRLERVELAELVSEALELYGDVAEDKGIELIAGPVEQIAVRADRNRMHQVMANLLDNAVKYTPPGGRVEASARADGGKAVLSVVDTGVGISADELPRIWDRLYRGDKSRSERGLGLGLALVRAIVAAHRGEATVESSPDRGTRFSVKLPALGEDAPPQPVSRNISHL
jgi:signal transduction histidine kinase